MLLYCRGGYKGWTVFYHFVGAVPGSTSLEYTINRLLRHVDAVNVMLLSFLFSFPCPVLSLLPLLFVSFSFSLTHFTPWASWLRQLEAYLMDMGMVGLVSAWTMARRKPKE